MPFNGLVFADADAGGTEREAVLPEEDFVLGGEEDGFVDGVVSDGVGDGVGGFVLQGAIEAHIAFEKELAFFFVPNEAACGEVEGGKVALGIVVSDDLLR